MTEPEKEQFKQLMTVRSAERQLQLAMPSNLTGLTI
jgi:hypothetical protein